MPVNPYIKGSPDDIPVVDGGTGASTPAGARSNLMALDETAHDLLDHTGLTGVGDLTVAAHSAIDHGPFTHSRLNVGTTAQAVASGDFASGLAGGNTVFYDQSVGSFTVATTTAALTVTATAITGMMGVGAAAGSAIAITGGAGGATSGSGGAVTIDGGDATTSGAGGNVAMRAGDGAGTGGNGGTATVLGGTAADGIGGSVVVNAGAGVGTNRSGGTLFLAGGDSTGTAAAGDVAINGGTATGTGAGGDLEFVAGNGSNGGHIQLFAGNGVSFASLGGPIQITGGTGGPSGDGGTISIYAGNGGSGAAGNGGHLNMGAGSGAGTAGFGGSVDISAGNGLGSGISGGNFAIYAGQGGVNAKSGWVFVCAYQSNDVNGQSVVWEGGQLALTGASNLRAGAAQVQGGRGFNNGGATGEVRGGHALIRGGYGQHNTTGLAQGGSVYIEAGYGVDEDGTSNKRNPGGIYIGTGSTEASLTSDLTSWNGNTVAPSTIVIGAAGVTVSVAPALNVGTGITPSTANGDFVAGDGTREMTFDASAGSLVLTGGNALGVGGVAGENTQVLYATTVVDFSVSGTAMGLIPAGALVLGVTARILTLVSGGGATDVEVGDGVDTNRWGNLGGLTIGLTSDPTTYGDNTVQFNNSVSAADVVLTGTGGTPTAGTVRVTLAYMLFTAPTS